MSSRNSNRDRPLPKQGGGTGRGRGKGKERKEPAKEVYGLDPQEWAESQTAPSSPPFRPVTNRRKPAHDRPPIQIAGNPDRKKKDFHRNKKANEKIVPGTDWQEGDAEENAEVNAHLKEKISGRNQKPSSGRDSFSSRYTPVPRNLLVERLEKQSTAHMGGWRAQSEVPTVIELLGAEVELPPNETSAPWETVEEYLEAHYALLREDAFSPLRDAVGQIRANPDADDDGDMCVYENARMVGITFASMGMCVKMTFSTNRARKRIRWVQSKRLCPGTLVAMSCDNFQSIIKIGTVAARPLAAVSLDPPEIDILLDKHELEIDPTKVWILVESRQSYFEAYKHTLRSLQRMSVQNFPLNEILTLQNKEIGVPEYLADDPIINLSQCYKDHPDKKNLKEVNVLSDWPNKAFTTSMDESQLEAVHRILTKELAIVQGPPGCGKTFVSVAALATMLENQKPRDPPILVACQTNHALDQLLNKIIEMEPNVIRLGGRTQDTDKIKERTLHQVRKSSTLEVKGGGYLRAKKQLLRCELKAKLLLESIRDNVIGAEAFFISGIISQTQKDSFLSITEDWVKVSETEKPSTPMMLWLGDYLIPVQQKHNLDLDYEDEDIAMEELKDLEAEYNAGFEDDFDDSLRGSFFSFRRHFEVVVALGVTEDEVDKAMKISNVWDIPDHIRPAMYLRMEKRLLRQLETELREISLEYHGWTVELKIARWEKDACLLERSKLIGMTTTGVSKYRSLVAALQPRICLIEEAAETLEGPLIVACYPTLQHLILVGDHKQLRGHCSVRELEAEPYNLGISMFERLVENEVEYTSLTKQRRMRPEIREIIMPIYPQLQDDVQVLNQPPIPGMGDTNIYFYAHNMREENDEMSKKNPHEAQMIVSLCEYLVENGVLEKHITILTFYTGQQRELNRLLRRHNSLNTDKNKRIRVATVDSFQGEENEIILLSLCRSNSEGSIGFLSIENRVCVALSRAKRGFYLFGNAHVLSRANRLWWDVVHILNGRQPMRISAALPITCERHRKTTYIEDLADWVGLNGGCREPCGQSLPCGHKCTLKCHPYDHIQVKCVDKCLKTLPCGHSCRGECWQLCQCVLCEIKVEKADAVNYLTSKLEGLPNLVKSIQPSIIQAAEKPTVAPAQVSSAETLQLIDFEIIEESSSSKVSTMSDYRVVPFDSNKVLIPTPASSSTVSNVALLHDLEV